ncbi:MAG: flagellar motor switch protein FliM [Ignavibacteria bacterium]
MAEILSQQEINTLLSGMPDEQHARGSVDASTKEVGREIVRFDFRMPRRLSSRQLQTFHAIHDSFADAMSSFLVSRLQTTAAVNVVSVEQMFYSEYVVSTPRPSCLYVFTIKELGAKSVMELNPALVLAIIARMLGGSTENVAEVRPITKIEQNIFKGMVLRGLGELQRTWTTLVESEFVLDRYETEADFIQIAPTSEIVLVVKLEVMLGDFRYAASLCFPTLPLEDVLATLQTRQHANTQRGADKGDWSGTILRTLETTKIPVTCILGETTLTLQQLKELEVGDLLITNTPVNGELRLMVGDRVRARGRPGISNGRTALKISHIIVEQDNNA